MTRDMCVPWLDLGYLQRESILSYQLVINSMRAIDPPRLPMIPPCSSPLAYRPPRRSSATPMWMLLISRRLPYEEIEKPSTVEPSKTMRAASN